MPDRETVCREIAALSLSVKVPVMKEVSVGVKVSCRLQVAPTTTKEHICAGTMDGTDEVAEESCRSALPQLVMFKLREEGVPTRMGAKSREAGAKQTEGAEVARSSLLMKEC